ncbi:MAG: AMP-binding protein [Treponemataceae bacterium]
METIQDLGTYTIPALFSNTIKKFSDCNALAFVSEKPFTYAQIQEKIKKVQLFLLDLGIKKDDKVAIFSTSMPNWGISYFAITLLGAVAVPLLPDFTVTEVESILTHAKVKALFVAEKLYEKVHRFTESVIQTIVKIDDISLVRGTVVASTQHIPPVDIKEEDLASLIYTSGTTGRSKGVMLTHKNLVFTAIHCQDFHRVNKRDKCLSFLPLSHVYEFTLGFLLQILCGSCVYYLERPPTVSTLLPALKQVRPTLMMSVPIIMEKIYKNKIIPTFTKKEAIKKLYNIRFFQKILHKIAGKSLKKTFGGKLKFFGIGGAKIDPTVEQFLKDAGFPYSIGYGLTETSPLVSGFPVKKTIPGIIGGTITDVEVKILNPNEHGIGEVIIKGPNVMKGYYNDEELTKSVFTTKEDPCGEGWFKSGDLGFLNKKNQLSLKGRLKNMILGSSGENIYPEDIEFVLNQHPLVAESIIAEDDNGLVAIVLLDKEKASKNWNIVNATGEMIQDFTETLLYKQEELMGELKFFVNDQVNKFSKIGRIQFIEDFEKTASQKIKRYVYNFLPKKKDDK